MQHSRLPILLSTALLGGCLGSPDSVADVALADPENSEIVFQAVDAGTGAALTDPEMTVRYLVRAPITLDASAVERVSPTEPYRITHPVAHDSLVAEIRLEASSYHRLDTVFAVARGASAGPFTVRMARRLGRAAAAGGRVGAGDTRTQAAPSRTEAQPPAAQPEPVAVDPDAGMDWTPLRAGDRAFQSGEWVRATTAYQHMQEPQTQSGSYAPAYQQARVRQGISHVNLNEWGSALDPLEDALTFPSPGHAAYLYLGVAQCVSGRMDAGRQNLAEVEGLRSTIDPRERSTVDALLAYHRAICSQGDFGLYQRSEDAQQFTLSAARAVQEFNAFIELAEALRPMTPQMETAIQDARRRIEAVQNRMLGR
jgi:hypothetical protein